MISYSLRISNSLQHYEIGTFSKDLLGKSIVKRKKSICFYLSISNYALVRETFLDIDKEHQIFVLIRDESVSATSRSNYFPTFIFHTREKFLFVAIADGIGITVV